ncbi:MAG: DUF2490 domain-containing protein [Bacteroidales bacterium]|nr:DUF2490 domain-containing protein [Bacteroidales bacterium]
MKRTLLFFLLFIPASLVSLAQSSCQLGLLPALNVNSKFSNDWSMNFKAESRQALIRDDFRYDYLLTDLSLAAAKKTGINTTVAAGYLVRVEGEEMSHRAIQQVSRVKRYSNFRLAHRLSADQTFSKDDYTEFRFRYRLSAEIPLAGQSLDPGEFFLKLNNEYLNSILHKVYDLEIRGGTFIGYALSSDIKLELGMDYRADSFIDGNPRHRYWIGLNFYQSIRN